MYGVYWPPEVKMEESIEAFVLLYREYGYEPCDDRDFEPGIEKVAIYIDFSGSPTHAARQLQDGSWTSKLREWEDIQHATLQALEDDHHNRGLGYGKVDRVMGRVRRI